jgi:uncharacterized integral membrane protein
MLAIYNDAFVFVRRSLLMLIGVAVFFEGINVLFGDQPGAQVAGWGILIYYFHRYFLFAEPFGFNSRATSMRRFGLFFLYYGAAILLLFAAMITAAVSFRSLPLGFAVVIGLSWLLAGVLGTLLPWSVDGDPRYSLRRGLRTAPRTLWHLILGPGVFTLISFWGAVLIESTTGSSGPAGFAVASLAQFLGVVNTILVTAILCRSYKDTLAQVGPPPLLQSDTAGDGP